MQSVITGCNLLAPDIVGFLLHCVGVEKYIPKLQKSPNNRKAGLARIQMYCNLCVKKF